MNAANHTCCAWTNTKALFNNRVLEKNENNDYCGADINNTLSFEDGRNLCCVNEGDDSTGDCDASKWPKGPAFNSILDFADRENDWIKNF